MSRMGKLYLLAGFCLCPALVFAQSLELSFSSLRSESGNLQISLYGEKDGFLSDPDRVLQGWVIPASQALLVVELPAAGVYALGILHDEDGDGEMDTNFIGMPREGMGASNNPKSRFGPPGWDDAKFSIGTETLTMLIELNYL